MNETTGNNKSSETFLFDSIKLNKELTPDNYNKDDFRGELKGFKDLSEDIDTFLKKAKGGR